MHDQPQAYRLKVDRPGLPAGSIVYRPRFYDWGCASKDTRRTGRQFVSVTRDPNGQPPSFTLPADELAEEPPPATVAGALMLLDLIEFGVKEGERADQILYWCSKLRRELEGSAGPRAK